MLSARRKVPQRRFPWTRPLRRVMSVVRTPASLFLIQVTYRLIDSTGHDRIECTGPSAPKKQKVNGDGSGTFHSRLYFISLYSILL